MESTATIMTKAIDAGAGGESSGLLARARQALLDALVALHDHRDSVIVIGAQAIYLPLALRLLRSLRPQRTATLPLTSVVLHINR